jgi:hypothetical protein
MFVNLECSRPFALEASADYREVVSEGVRQTPQYFAETIGQTAEDEDDDDDEEEDWGVAGAPPRRQERFSALLNFRSISSIELFIVGSILGERAF